MIKIENLLLTIIIKTKDIQDKNLIKEHFNTIYMGKYVQILADGASSHFHKNQFPSQQHEEAYFDE